MCFCFEALSKGSPRKLTRDEFRISPPPPPPPGWSGTELQGDTFEALSHRFLQKYGNFQLQQNVSLVRVQNLQLERSLRSAQFGTVKASSVKVSARVECLSQTMNSFGESDDTFQMVVVTFRPRMCGGLLRRLSLSQLRTFNISFVKLSTLITLLTLAVWHKKNVRGTSRQKYFSKIVLADATLEAR